MKSPAALCTMFGSINSRRRRLSRRQRHGRVAAAIAVAAILLGRPTHLESLRWWQSQAVIASLALTDDQIGAIDQIYKQRLPGRRACIERLIAASNHVDQLMWDGTFDDNTLRQTQEVVKAAAEERALMQSLAAEITVLLTDQQRRILADLRPGAVVE